MKKKISRRLICLITAGILLLSTIVVVAIEGSPYETFKRTVFQALTEENLTLQSELTMKFNGEVIESDGRTLINSEVGRISKGFDNRTVIEYNNLHIESPIWGEEIWHSARIQMHTWRTNNSLLGDMGIGVEDLNSARFRFAEAFIDLVVGDVRNNFTMNSVDGGRRVGVAINHNQLPEIIRLGIDVALEDSLRWHYKRDLKREDFRYPQDIPIRNITLNRLSVDADIDNADNLKYLNVHANVTTVDIFGDEGTFEFSFVVEFSDIGTSVVEIPIPGAVELFTPEFFEHKTGSRHGSLFFRLNADGSVNLDSLATIPPRNARFEEIYGQRYELCDDEEE